MPLAYIAGNNNMILLLEPVIKFTFMTGFFMR